MNWDTTFYSLSHGSGDNFGSSFGIPGSGSEYLDASNDPDTEPVSSTNSYDPGGGVGYYIAAKTAALDTPPYNFVHMDACDSADHVNTASLSLANAFMGTGGKDQAFVGWAVAVGVNYELVSYTNVIWDTLAQGHTLLEADIIASVDGFWPHEPLFKSIDFMMGSPAFPTIWGDPQLKLHGVYLGIDANQWFLPQ